VLANGKVSNHSFDQIHVSHYFRCQGYQHEDAKIDYLVYCNKAATHRDITMLLAKTRGQLFFDITKARGMLVRPDLSTVSSARYVDGKAVLCPVRIGPYPNPSWVRRLTQHKSHTCALFHNTTMILQSRFQITGRLQRLG